MSIQGSAISTVQIAVDPSVQYQTWEGFGTSLAWWAHIVGAYPEPLRSTLVQKAIGDLELNILRYNIGGGEAPGLNFMEPRARLPGFLAPDGKYDWNADEAQRWVLHRGIELGANKFEAFSNSPPYFMTRSGSVTGAIGGSSNLKPECMDAFTNYLATVVKHFRDTWKVNFETLNPMNEPCAKWWTYKNRQEGCHVSPGQEQSELILSTAAALQDAGLKTKISASDESHNDWAVTSWDALSPQAKHEIYQINTHCYSGNQQWDLRMRAVRDDKRLWMSEYGDGDATGMKMAHQIVTDLRDMRPSAWIYWQIIDGGSGWGCIDIDLNHGSQTYSLNRKYFVMSQFSHFIRPGAKFLDVNAKNAIGVLRGSQLVLVVVSDHEQSSKFDLSRFAHLGATVSVTQTSPAAELTRLPSLKVVGKTFEANLPAHSVTTFTIEECY